MDTHFFIVSSLISLISLFKLFPPLALRLCSELRKSHVGSRPAGRKRAGAAAQTAFQKI